MKPRLRHRLRVVNRQTAPWKT